VNDARQSWARAWRGIGAVDDGVAVRDALLAAYAEPHRKYHTLQHLHECLDLLAPATAAAARPCEVEVALWFHDAIYDVRRSDNEERSADWASAAVAAAGVAAAIVERIRSLVLATKAHGLAGQRRRAAPGRHRPCHPGRARRSDSLNTKRQIRAESSCGAAAALRRRSEARSCARSWIASGSSRRRFSICASRRPRASTWPERSALSARGVSPSARRRGWALHGGGRWPS
jgi:hypothetical protein